MGANTSLGYDARANPIQAFPIHRDTYISPSGGVSDLSVEGYGVIHAAADVDLTFTLDDSGTLSLSLPAGADIAIGYGIVSVTSTVQIWMS